jgi:hypothetical protein
MALQPSLTPSRNGTFLTERWRALRVFTAWIHDSANGEGDTLQVYCNRHRLNYRRAVKILMKDPVIQAQVFEPMTTKAKLSLMKVITKVDGKLDTEELPVRDLLKTGEFLAKYTEGGFSKSDQQFQVGVQINLPTGPISGDVMKKVDAKLEEELGDLL